MVGGYFVTCLKNKQKNSFKEIEMIFRNQIDVNKINQSKEEEDIFSDQFNLKIAIKNELKPPERLILLLLQNIPNIYFIRIERKKGNLPTNFDQFNFKFTCKIIYLQYFDIFNNYESIILTKILNKQIIESINTFKIEFKQRCSNLDVKKSVFESILYHLRHKTVQLEKPQLKIHVQIVKNFIGLGVSIDHLHA